MATLNDNTYGTLYEFTDFTDFYSDGIYYAGYKLEWAEVLDNHGEGTYRFIVESTILGNSSTIYSESFCLKDWICKLADDTVKFETYFSGTIGSKDDDFTMSVRSAKLVYIRNPKEGNALFDVENDPWEKVNLIEDEPTVAGRLDDMLADYYGKLKGRRSGLEL